MEDEHSYRSDEEQQETPPKPKFLKRNARWGELMQKVSKPGEIVPKTMKHTKQAVLERAEAEKQQEVHEGKLSPVKIEHDRATISSKSSRSRATAPISSERKIVESNSVKVDKKARGRAELNENNYVQYIEQREKNERNAFLKMEKQLTLSGRHNGMSRENSVNESVIRNSEGQDEDDDESEDDDFVRKYISPLDKLPNPFEERQDENEGPMDSRQKNSTSIVGRTFHPKSPNDILKESSSNTIVDLEEEVSYRNMYERKREYKNRENTVVEEEEDEGEDEERYDYKSDLEDTVSPQQSMTPNRKSAHSNQSMLVKRYFHTKSEDKQQKKKQMIQQRKQEKEEELKKERDIQELEEQLHYYRTENKKIKEMKEELQTERQKLILERTEFVQMKEREKEKIDSYRENEMRKLQQEKRVVERQIKANQQHVSRREQEKEIEKLKQKIIEMSQEFKLKEKNSKASLDLLRRKCEQYKADNDELREELKRRELERIEIQFNERDQSPQSKKIKTSPSIRVRHEPEKLQRESYQNRSHSKTEPVVYDSDDRGDDERYSQIADRVPVTKSRSSFNRYSQKELEEEENEHESDSSSIWNADSEDEVEIPKAHSGVSRHSETELTRYVKKLRIRYLDGLDQLDDRIGDDDEATDRLISSNKLQGGKTERKFLSGRVEIIHSNGTVKKVMGDRTVIILFNNGDKKKTLPNDTTIYYYATANTTQISLPNGVEIFKFANLQVERHYPEGIKEISFPDSTVKYIKPNGEEEVIFADGTVQLTTVERDRVITFPDGHKETWYRDGTKRIEQPSSNNKTIHSKKHYYS